MPNATEESWTLNTAILSAVTLGRGGKGAPVIFASGNGGAAGMPVSYPARLPFVMAIGSIDTLNNFLTYTQAGDSLDLVAPSGAPGLQGDVWSTDQWGMPGLNPSYGENYPKYPWPWDCGVGNDISYNCRMGGTSAAWPVVAGVASLLLARDPDLLARDTLADSSSDYNVYDILCGSAVPLDSIVPSRRFGYGRVDAFRAILSIARGDANNDADISIGDATFLIDHLFLGGPPPWPDSLLGDVNCDGGLSIGDIGLLVDHLFMTGVPLPLPCFEFND